MRIELLTSPGCPNAESARKILADCLSSLGIDEPIIDRIGTYPSPTVLIDGVDVMRPTAKAPTGDACRLDLPLRNTSSTHCAFVGPIHLTVERAIDARPVELKTSFESLKSHSQLRGFGSNEFIWGRCSSVRF